MSAPEQTRVGIFVAGWRNDSPWNDDAVTLIEVEREERPQVTPAAQVPLKSHRTGAVCKLRGVVGIERQVARTPHIILERKALTVPKSWLS